MSKKNNILTAPVVSKALRAGDPCILQDGGSLTLEVTGKNQGKWLYRGRKQGSRTLIKLICGYAPETGLSEARSKSVRRHEKCTRKRQQKCTSQSGHF